MPRALAVLGRDLTVATSLLDQLTSGCSRPAKNAAAATSGPVRRSERVRAVAQRLFMWVDSRESMRKALAAGSRPTHVVFEPGMEVLFHKTDRRPPLPWRPGAVRPGPGVSRPSCRPHASAGKVLHRGGGGRPSQRPELVVGGLKTDGHLIGEARAAGTTMPR